MPRKNPGAPGKPLLTCLSQFLFSLCHCCLYYKTNSEPCPYWKLLPKPTVLIARLSKCLFSAFPSPLGYKQVTTELPDGMKEVPHSILALMVSTIYFTSSSLTYGPAGRHIPTLKMASLTPLTYAGASLYTGCLCIGFQTGRASI